MVYIFTMQLWTESQHQPSVRWIFRTQIWKVQTFSYIFSGVKFFQVILRVEDTSSRPEKTKQGTSDREKLKKKNRVHPLISTFKLCVGFSFFFTVKLWSDLQSHSFVVRYFRTQIWKVQTFSYIFSGVKFFCGHFTLVSEKKEDPQQAQWKFKGES